MGTPETLTALSAVGAAILAFIEYRKAICWKSAEWLAQQTRQFAAEPEVRNAMRMLDWNGRHVLLYPDHPQPSKRQVVVTHAEVAEALRVKTKAPASGDGTNELRFNRKEAAIRDCFDAFFEGMNRFAEYEAQELVTAQQLEGHVAYWARKIGGERAPSAGASGWTTELKQALRLFAESYGYGEGLALLDRVASGKARQPPSWGELLEDLLWKLDWLRKDIARRRRRRGATRGSR